MLKLRLKRSGRKKQPLYRLVVMESITQRDGRPIDQVGYYNPITKQSYFDAVKITRWLKFGVKPTPTVLSLLRKAKVIQV